MEDSPTVPLASLAVTTPRLTLRRVRPQDADAYLAWRSRPEVVRFMYLAPWTPDTAQARMAEWTAAAFEKRGDVLILAVEHEGTVVGEGMLRWAEGAEQVEIGYAFHPDVAGLGFASEAGRALLDLAFDRFGFHRAFARIDAENLPSVRVAQRLGMRLEARLVESDVRPADGVWSTELVYALLASEHAERRRA